MNKYPLAALLLGLSIGCASDPKKLPVSPVAEVAQGPAPANSES